MKKSFLLKILLFIALSISNSFAQNFSLPAPTGEYKVGTTKFYLQDVYREEKLTENKLDYREFMVRVWYPSDDISGSENLRYLEGYNEDTLKYFWNMFQIPEKIFDLIGQVPTNSHKDAPISQSRSKFPVIIFSHGYGLGIPELYTFMEEDLASDGFIVLSITHPYESVEVLLKDKAPIYLSENRANQMLQENLMEYAVMKNASTDEEILAASKSVLENSPIAMESLEEWVKDAEYLLNQMESPSGTMPAFIKEKLDLDNIGVLGHSFGGAMAGQLALDDSRIKAILNMDGFQYGALMNKMLNFDYAMVYSDFNKKMNDAILTSSSKDLYFITIPGTMHFTFTDMVTYPEVFDKKSFTGTIDPNTFVDLIKDLIINYFNKYLYGEDIVFPSDAFIDRFNADVKSIRK